MKAKELVAVIFVSTLGVFAVGHFISDQRMFSQYKKSVVSQVNIAIGQLSIREINEMTLERYTELHLAGCHLSNQLNELASDKDKHYVFSDDECVEYMHKTRPQAISLPRATVRKTANQ